MSLRPFLVAISAAIFCGLLFGHVLRGDENYACSDTPPTDSGTSLLLRFEDGSWFKPGEEAHTWSIRINKDVIQIDPPQISFITPECELHTFIQYDYSREVENYWAGKSTKGGIMYLSQRKTHDISMKIGFPTVIYQVRRDHSKTRLHRLYPNPHLRED